MAIERGETAKFVEKMPSRDKSVIVLAVNYFWLKYMRRGISLRDLSNVDFEDPIAVLGINLELERQASDIDRDAQAVISAIILNNPKRHEVIPRLSDAEVRDICSDLDEMFKNQEYCASCEGWSYYYDSDSEDLAPEEFAVDTASMMLYLCSSRYSCINKHVDNFRMDWFSDIYSGEERGKIIEAVLAEKLPRGFHGLLPPTGETRLT